MQQSRNFLRLEKREGDLFEVRCMWFHWVLSQLRFPHVICITVKLGGSKHCLKTKFTISCIQWGMRPLQFSSYMQRNECAGSHTKKSHTNSASLTCWCEKNWQFNELKRTKKYLQRSLGTEITNTGEFKTDKCHKNIPAWNIEKNDRTEMGKKCSNLTATNEFRQHICIINSMLRAEFRPQSL